MILSRVKSDTAAPEAGVFDFLEAFDLTDLQAAELLPLTAFWR